MRKPASIRKPVASLPMYDWPEVRGELDALWTALCEAFRKEGIDAPDALERGKPDLDVWLDPALVLSQICGLPFALHASGKVPVLGSIDNGLEDCPPGTYRSRLVARKDDERTKVSGFAGSLAALNGVESWSGHGAFVSSLPDAESIHAFFADALMTGSHRASIIAVAQSHADLAAIDAVSWELVSRHEQAASHLRVIASSPIMPAPPLITGGFQDAARMAALVSVVLDHIPESTRKTLLIKGLAPQQTADYAHFSRPDWP